MKDLLRYKGVFPAFYACYDETGRVSPERVRALARYLLGKGVNGLYVGGSSGECIYQSVEERKLTLENVMAEVGGKIPVIAHVACNNTADSRLLAAHAEALGVDAIAAIPPIYFHLPEHAVAGYWNDISAAAPHTDFIIYNIPQLAGTALTLPLLARMRENPRVIGVKNSSMPVQDIQMFRTACSGGFVVFNGPDEQFCSGLAAGASGGIGGTYAVMPELYQSVYQLTVKGNLEAARRVQDDCCAIIYKMCTARGNLYATMKGVLRLQGIDIGGVRPPLPASVPEDTPIIQAAAGMIRQAKEKLAESC